MRFSRTMIFSFAVSYRTRSSFRHHDVFASIQLFEASEIHGPVEKGARHEGSNVFQYATQGPIVSVTENNGSHRARWLSSRAYGF